FLSTLPARGATALRKQPTRCCSISIHAPREGSDCSMLSCLTVQDNFYPRSPRGERPHHLCDVLVHAGISIHAPREGSDVLPALRGEDTLHISIHAPREGS